jgi:hypothetical protein
MSLKLLSWSSSSAASARRLLSRSSHQRLSFDALLPPPINVAAYVSEAAINAPIDLANVLIFIIDTARFLPVQAGFLNHDTGTLQRH